MSLKLLILAAILTLTAVVMPPISFPSQHFNYFFIIDITRSMNVQDYQTASGTPLSRLEKVKADTLSVIQQLPCGSTVALGVFTERTPTMIHSSIEVCEGYAELRQSINHIDWRMAWVADSNIILALYNSLKLARTVELDRSTLVFFTDGHEAPPMNMNYAPDFNEIQDEYLGVSYEAIEGIIIGTGQHGLSRIPKYDEEGTQVGFYKAEDVPQRSTFGQPLDPSKIEGYVPRNAPWGNKPTSGNEHMSSVKEGHLKAIAQLSRLHYEQLQSAPDLYKALTQQAFIKTQVQLSDLRFIPTCLAWFLLLVVYCPKRIKQKLISALAG